MTDKPEIKVGQRWVTRDGEIVRVLEVADHDCNPVTVRGDGNPYSVDLTGRFGFALCAEDLISLAPQTVKREVALYRHESQTESLVYFTDMPFTPAMIRVSEPVQVEFTLLPGEHIND